VNKYPSLHEFIKWVLLLVVVFMSQQSFGQIKKPDLSISSQNLVSVKGYQPIWLTANRNGKFDSFSRYNSAWSFSLESVLDNNKTFDYSYGAEVLVRGADQSELYIHQGYVRLKGGVFRLDAGRIEQTFGEHLKGLSSGSLLISNNTTPIPMVNISMPEYETIPFTNGLLKLRGNLLHGWLEDSRYVTDVYLHQKSLYLQAGFDHWPLQAYGGMVHAVQWGGNSPQYGKLPSSISDYTRIFFARGGGSSSPRGESINALGNHLGIWDFGLKGEVEKWNFKLYWQHYFEDSSGMEFQNIGDGLFGIGVLTQKKQFITGVLVEYIRTINQSGAGLHDKPGDVSFCTEENCGYKYGGRDNYYNNSIYRSGWSYNGNILGNPLMLTTHQISVYLPDSEIYQPFVENNRIAAHHMGIEGYVSSQLNYRLLATYTLHHGNYSGANFGQEWGSKDPANNRKDYTFYPALEQWNFLLEMNYDPLTLQNVSFKTGLALDTGQVTNNLGLIIGVTWNIKDLK
jgi:hypothetical protein|tara:strand:+ start:19812 stop:21347 length:1536 start_codon:yes stop_codon:yes gene_type:complete